MLRCSISFASGQIHRIFYQFIITQHIWCETFIHIICSTATAQIKNFDFSATFYIDVLDLEGQHRFTVSLLNVKLNLFWLRYSPCRIRWFGSWGSGRMNRWSFQRIGRGWEGLGGGHKQGEVSVKISILCESTWLSNQKKEKGGDVVKWQLKYKHLNWT